MVLEKPRCRSASEEAMREEPDVTFFLLPCSLVLFCRHKRKPHGVRHAKRGSEGRRKWIHSGERRGREDEHVEGQAKNSESELHALHDGRTNLVVRGKEQIRWQRESLAVARGAQEQCGGAEV